MSGFLLNMLEGQLGLSEADKAVIEPTLPYVKNVIDAAVAAQPTLEALVPYMVKAAPLLTRLLSDLKVLGPAASALLGDGFVNVGGAVEAAHDIDANIKANPKTIEQGKQLYASLAPLMDVVQKNWPKIAPAVAVLQKRGAGQIKMGDIFTEADARMKASGGLGADAGIVRGG